MKKFFIRLSLLYPFIVALLFIIIINTLNVLIMLRFAANFLCLLLVKAFNILPDYFQFYI